MYAGVDIGSVTAKAVIIDGQGKVLAFTLAPTTHDREKSGRQVLEAALAMAGISREDVKYTVTTGYGRRAFAGDEALPEIICHARGTMELFPPARVIIDIGGQDSKVIELDEKGRVSKFEMNDKCAAGTGRFLEVLTERILGLSLEELGPLSLKSRNPCTISSICTVFAETEIVSLLSEHRQKEDIVSGMHRAIARRVIGMGLSGQIEYRDPVIFSGGVARNVGVVAAIEAELRKKVSTPEQPQITAALGAAFFAKERHNKT
jgi:predicted CoA-substrate-specific enzyme activase